MKNDPIRIQEQKNLERKNILQGNWKHYKMALEQYTDEIDKNLGNDLIEGMLKDRREWVNSTRQDKKIPEDVKPFYDRFKEIET